MKILIIKTAPGEINISEVKYNIQELGLARALVKAGHQCDVMCCADKEPSIKKIEVDEKQIILYCVRAKRILKNGIMKDVTEILDQYEILQVSEYNQLYTWHLSKKYKDKLVVYHGPYYSDFNKRYNMMCQIFDIFLLNRYHKLKTYFITKSIFATDFLIKKDIKNVQTVGVGIDIMTLTNTNEQCQDEFITEIKKFDVDYKLLYIGTLDERRNSIFLLNILKLLRDKNINVGLVLVGKESKEYKEKFWNTVKSLRLENYIKHKSVMEQKKLSKVYRNVDMFLMPTRYDIFGMVILEAMYFGLPVVSSINGGSKMLINSDENGVIIEKFNLNEWVCCILDLIKDVNKRESMGKKANEIIVNGYTWDKLVPSFLRAYTSVLEKNTLV